MNDVINRANLPSVLNGVTMSECDKVIEPFLEERSCDEVWHTVRALRDFYDWVMSENAVEPCKDAVSREWLLNELEEMNVANFYELNEHSAEAYHDIKNAVNAMPSIDLVLCRECKRFFFTGECTLYGRGRKPDDYCSKGERVSEDD